ncbi:hypothetical protein PQ43W_13 [Ralstonia phage PQ43W]
MATTNVPLPTFSPTGLVTSSEQAILNGVFADYVAAFALNGKSLGTGLTTPQGQLAQSQAHMVAAFQAALAQLIANVDPATSSGSFQDALGRIYFLTRKAATFATVVATLGGVANATLAAGLQAQSSDGSIWTTTAPVVLGAGGSATATFQAVVPGSLPVAGVNDLKIYQQVPNWQTVTNTAGSTSGTDTESRQAFESRRAASVVIGGKGSAASVFASVMAVNGVTDAYIYNNGSDAAITQGVTNYPIPAHSIACVVTGGADTDVAKAILAKLDAGCGMSTQAATTVNLQDTVNYAAPYPTYPIRFVRPTVTQVYMTVNVANLSTLPANYITLVQQAVAKAFASGYLSTDGTINLARARIGGQIVAAGFGAPILALGNITPVSLFIGTSAAPTSGASLTMGIDQQPQCTVLNITVNAVSV